MNATTHAPSRRALETAGMERRQAEAIAEQLRTAACAGPDEPATTGSLAVLKADIASVRTEFGAEIAVLRAEMRAIRWVLGFQAARSSWPRRRGCFGLV